MGFLRAALIKQVKKLPNDVVFLYGETYMTRYYLLKTDEFGIFGGAGIRIHEIHRSDDDRDLHDHPWDFLSVMLSGTYTETTPDRLTRKFSAPCVLLRRAEQLHALNLPDGPVWTLVFTGRIRRAWGFLGRSTGQWVDRRGYFARRRKVWPA